MIVTKEGALASFYTVNKAPIKHLRVYFSPKQAGSGDPSPENVREISGWNGLSTYQHGKNLFDINAMSQRTGITINENTFIGTASAIRLGGQASRIIQPLFIPAGTTVSVHCTCYTTAAEEYRSGGGWAIIFTYEDDTDQSRLWYTRNNDITPTYYSGTFIAEKNIKSYYFTYYNYASQNTWYVSDLQIEVGSTATKYEPYKDQIINTNWSNDIGTIYGGYVDLITGELIQEYELASSTWGQAKYGTAHQNTGYQWSSIPFKNSIIIAGESGYTYLSYCNVGKCNWSGSDKDFSHFYPDYSSSLKTFVARVILPSETDDNLIINCIGKLKTPIVYQLTPTQLQTFIGQNNIWSNADHVEVEYELAESNDELYRRRNIILNSQPHLITPQASPTQAFMTDIAAPLNEYKIYFGPTQDKSSIPTLSNIKAIDGHTAIPLLINNIATSIAIPFKVYGGYIDIKRQKLVITAKMYELDGSEDEGWGDGGVYLNRQRYFSLANGLANIEYGNGKTSVLACDQLYVAPNGTSASYSSYTGDIVTVGSYNPQLYVAVNSITTLADWKAHLNANPLHLVGKMVTPIEYDLDLTNLKTVQGLNEITNLTYDKIELSYWSHYDSWPKEYERVDYLQGIGDRTYIDTGIAGDDDTIIMDFTIMPITRGSYSGHIVGNHNGEDKKCWRFIQSTSTIDGAFNFTLNSRKAGASPRSPIINDISTIINNKFNIRMQYNLGTVIYDGVVYTTSTTETTEEKSNLNIIIGANGPNVVGGTSTVSYARFYDHFKIQKQGVVVRDYIPCIRKSDNKPGFYDIINKTFNPSLGDRDFIAGNDN